MQNSSNPFTISHGWLDQARHISSPNYDERPTGCYIDLLVIHNISLPPGEFGGGFVHQLFCNQLDCSTHPYFEKLVDLKVSSHLLIEREGMITQFVAFDKRAWHAGASSYLGRERCNDFSVGIELEGEDTLPYTEQQYSVLAGITRCLLATYATLTSDRITGHSDIAPDRKTDPGPAFDWQKYKNIMGTC